GHPVHRRSARLPRLGRVTHSVASSLRPDLRTHQPMSRLGRESRRLNPAEDGSTGGVSGHGDRTPRNVRCGEFDRATYQPYYAQLPATRETSKEAAAATAAGTVLDCGRGSGRVAPAKDMGTMTVHF